MFLRQIEFRDWPVAGAKYPFNLPALQGAKQLSFSGAVTFFVGENGSGKSTLLEAIAIACGFNPEGGSRSNQFSSMATESSLYQHLKLSWFPKVTNGFFLRAESFFNFSSHLDEIEKDNIPPYRYASYGGKSLHQQSHGESFLSLFANRFRGKNKAIYLLDEPEAALSPARQLALMRIIWELDQSGQAQFIIATHSPILLGYPKAQILNFDVAPISPIEYKQTEHYLITKQFLSNPESIFQELFKPDR